MQTVVTTDGDDNGDEDAQSDAAKPVAPKYMTAEQARRERATGMEDPHAHESNIWRKIMMPGIGLIILLIVLVVGFRLAPQDSPSDDDDKQKTPTVLRLIRQRLAGHLSKPPGTPIEQDLQEAVKIMAIEAEQAKVKLDAIITVYGTNRTKETAECLRVAQMLLEEIDHGIQQRLAVINEALKWCSEQLTNQPKDVSKVSRALIDLYKDKTWAKSQVEQAQQLRDQADKLLEQPETKSSGSEK